MTNKLSRAFVALLMLSVAAPALAQDATVRVSNVRTEITNAPATTAAPANTVEATAKARASQEIDRRISSLSKLLSRINAMTKVDASFKAALASTTQAQITDLTNLKATISAETSTTALKVEIQSIGKSHRIYALVLPQATIGAAAERVQTMVGMFTQLGAKLQTRIASSTGDTAAAVAAMTDFNAKVADAQRQAAAAVNYIAGLQPDNGDKTIKASNDAALKRARADIRVAQQDFVAARKDAETIIKALGGNLSASASSTVQTP